MYTHKNQAIFPIFGDLGFHYFNRSIKNSEQKHESSIQISIKSNIRNMEANPTNIV